MKTLENEIKTEQFSEPLSAEPILPSFVRKIMKNEFACLFLGSAVVTFIFFNATSGYYLTRSMLKSQHKNEIEESLHKFYRPQIGGNYSTK